MAPPKQQPFRESAATDTFVPCPPEHYVHSSFTPNDAQFAQYTVNLKAINRAARECDGEIAKLHDLLAARQNKRDELRVHASRYRSILSPIRRLPKESLLEIFSHCITDYFRTAAVGAYGLLNEPSKLPIMRLLRVCAHWHHMILSTGSLWSQFQCEVDDTFENGGTGWKCLEMHLERSQDSPLSFLIFGDAILPSHSLFHRLLQETRRWRHASFMFDTISLRGWGSALTALPCLQILHIESTTISDDDEEVPSIEFPSNNLLYLDISPAILHRVVVPFKHLRNLVLSHYSSTAQLSECLCNATHVEFIEFWQGTGHDDEDDFNYTEFRENGGSRKTLGVQAMTIFISGPDCQGALLNLLSTCFHMPHLHTFKLGQTSPVGILKTIVKNTVTFLETIPHLKSLYVHGLPLSDAKLLQIVRATPLVEEMSLTFLKEENGVALLKELTASPAGGVSLPHLRGLNLSFTHGNEALLDALLEVVYSRFQLNGDEAAEWSKVATMEEIVVGLDDASRSREAAMFMKAAAHRDYALRRVSETSFILLKAGCKHRWHEVAGLDYTNLQYRSSFEKQ